MKMYGIIRNKIDKNTLLFYSREISTSTYVIYNFICCMYVPTQTIYSFIIIPTWLYVATKMYCKQFAISRE